MALAWFLPGMLLVAHWRLPNLDWAGAGLLASGLGICWMILVVLVLYWLPGGINRWQLVAAYEIGALGLLVALWWHPPLPLAATVPSVWKLMLLLLLIVAPLRLPGTGYHEFHVDETFILTRARQAIEGEEDAFARHAKGAGELAIATVIYRALDTVNERYARLPFELASILSVLVMVWLGYRLFSPSVGFWAGVLLSVNGFALGLSRILQYQAIMLLLSPLVVLRGYSPSGNPGPHGHAREGRLCLEFPEGEYPLKAGQVFLELIISSSPDWSNLRDWTNLNPCFTDLG